MGWGREEGGGREGGREGGGREEGGREEGWGESRVTGLEKDYGEFETIVPMIKARISFRRWSLAEYYMHLLLVIHHIIMYIWPHTHTHTHTHTLTRAY